MRGAEVLPHALLDLFVILWKFVVISFTRVDTCNEKYKARVVWKQAVCRYVKRVEAYGEGLRRSGLSRDSRGSGRALSQRQREKVEGMLSPLAKVGENGEISWAPIMEMTILAARSKD